MKKLLVTVGLVGIASALVVLGCGRDRSAANGDAAGADEAEGVVVHVSARAVEQRSFEDVVTAPGQWISAGQIVVSAPFPGVVDSLSVRPGDRVAAGQVLCRLMTRDSRAVLRGAEMLARQARDEAERVEAARALDLARQEIVRVPVTAPRAGTVTEVPVQSGTEFAEFAEIASIQAPDAIVFEARVDPADASRVREGEQARVIERDGRAARAEAPGVAGPRRATVLRILPAASASDQATLIWLAPTESPSMPPPEIGRFGTATITAGAPHVAPAVPDSAVVQDDLTGQTRVAVIEAEKRAIWTPVALGAGDGGWHELRPPAIAPGTLVVTQGQRGLPDSTRVEAAAR